MVCDNCINKDICKIYFFMSENSLIADIDINNCKRINRNSFISNEVEKTQDTRNKTMFTNEILSINRDINKIDALSKEKDKIKKEEKKNNVKNSPKPKVTISTDNIEVKPIGDAVCSTCNGLTVEDDLNACTECGKEVCSNCSIYQPDIDQTLCDECWS